MSDSLIAFQPAIDDPSNISPSVSASSSITVEHIVRCCHLPLGSVKRRSTQSISSSLIRDRILSALLAIVALALCSFTPDQKRRQPGKTPGTAARFELGSHRFPRRGLESGGQRIFHRCAGRLCRATDPL